MSLFYKACRGPVIGEYLFLLDESHGQAGAVCCSDRGSLFSPKLGNIEDSLHLCFCLDRNAKVNKCRQVAYYKSATVMHEKF